MNKRKIYTYKVCKSYSSDIWGGFLRKESSRDFLVKKIIFMIYIERLLKKNSKNNKISFNLNSNNKNFKFLKLVSKKFKNIEFYKKLNLKFNYNNKIFREIFLKLSKHKVNRKIVLKPLVRFFFELILYYFKHNVVNLNLAKNQYEQTSNLNYYRNKQKKKNLKKNKYIKSGIK